MFFVNFLGFLFLKQIIEILSPVLIGLLNIFVSLINNLDPSLLQNVFIGILMIFIFIGGLIFQDKKTIGEKGKFIKMVIFEKILNIKTNTIITISGLFILAFLKDTIINDYHSVTLISKILIITTIIYIVIFLVKPIINFGKFIRGNTYEFEKKFLDSFKTNNIKNEEIKEKLLKSWFFFRQDKTETNERDFTMTFISHIDGAIKIEEFQLATELAQTYYDNLNHRDIRRLQYDIRPKVLERSEKLRYEAIINKKAFKEDIEYREYNYFQNTFFNKIVEKLAKNMDGGYTLMDKLKTHIKAFRLKLKSTNQKEEKKSIETILKVYFTHFAQYFSKTQIVLIYEKSIFLKTEKLQIKI